MLDSHKERRRLSVQNAFRLSEFLWPNFVYEQGCFFLAVHSGSNPPPKGDTATGWESFVNHTHILDEFAHDKSVVTTLPVAEEAVYNEVHPDFVAACELGKLTARMWALKLNADYPRLRFRVYYTELDNPIVRFHCVRDDEPMWLTDDAFNTSSSPFLLNSLVFDTTDLVKPILGPVRKTQ